MIYLTKLDPERTRFLINYRLIERIEERGNTMIFLQGGKTHLVDESSEEILEKIVLFETEIIRQAYAYKNKEG